ncbi:unnamed protein product, partial [Choristocarpus tenellus]
VLTSIRCAVGYISIIHVSTYTPFHLFWIVVNHTLHDTGHIYFLLESDYAAIIPCYTCDKPRTVHLWFGLNLIYPYQHNKKTTSIHASIHPLISTSKYLHKPKVGLPSNLTSEDVYLHSSMHDSEGYEKPLQ